MLGRVCVWLVVVTAGCGRFDFADQRTGGDAAVLADGLGVTDGPADSNLDAGPNFDDGCVLALHMDEPQWTGAPGEVTDSCGGNNGTVVGGATTVPNGTRGRAGKFDGTGCIEIPSAANLNATTALTISAWIDPTGDPSNSFGIVSKRINVDVSTAYDLFLWTGNTIFVDIDDTRDQSAVAFPTATWKQTTIVYDGSLDPSARLTYYVDGQFDRNGAETDATIAQVTADLSVGCLPLSGPAQQFIGLIDDVQVWTRPLSADDINAWYRHTLP